MLFLRCIALCVLLAFTLGAKPPQLTPQDTRAKIEEILKAHVSHQKLTPEIVQRALLNYIEELDPAKVYFLESEITLWINPSELTLNQTLKEYKEAAFPLFQEIHTAMIHAIERRSLLEKEIRTLPLVECVSAADFKEMTWAKTEEELKERLSKIRSLQLKTAEKLSTGPKEQFMQRLDKRRQRREQEVLGANAQEQEKIILSYVLKATSSALDSQTLYFTPTEADQFMIQVQQRLFGIGAQLRDDLDGFTITKVVEGSPAAASNKLKMGDKIIAVNQEIVVGMDIVEAVSLIRGPQGSSVELTLLRTTNNQEEKLLVPLIRGEIVLKESRLETSYEPYGDGIIATLHLFSFYQDTNSSSASDLAEAIKTLKQNHSLKGIILDLRDNGGGLLPQAVSVSGLFLSKGIVVSIKDNTGALQHLRNFDNQKLWDGPLLVLTSRTSASAAEIVAQTLQDYGRALVVGDSETFGKGTFQTFTLESANFGKVNPTGEYKVTRGRYYTVSGKSPQLVGVQSDISVPSLVSQMEIGEKYSKFPVATDQIPPNFHDDLADIPFVHRHQLEKIYKFQIQPILTTYRPWIEPLKKNSQERIAQNKNYQNLLQRLSKEADEELPDLIYHGDLQLTEAANIMKDLLYFLDKNAA
jgi:carboxyl-terminal processing protease